MDRKILFICVAVKWFDKVNGNTYHSVRITRCKDNKTIVGQFQYGYGVQYQATALEVMAKEKWIPKKYRNELRWSYERENKYPIYWNCRNGLKREMIANGKI